MEVYTILDTTIPSRSLWQMLFGAVLTVGLFINHFMITRKKTRKLWRIQINQGIVLLYDHNVWAGMWQMAVLRGLLAKFGQNEDLKEKLLDTGDAYLVECAYKDTIWACGIRLNEDERFDINKWRGQNILGFTLMEVRDALKNT